MTNPVVWQRFQVTPDQRAALKTQSPCMLWFTGLSGSGKTTVANALDTALYDRGCHTYVLDGDNVRHGLCRDLGFSAEDRSENIRRMGEVGRMLVDAGLIVISAFISPFEQDRQRARTCVDERRFIEIFMDTPLEVCKERDPKGFYARARSGEMAAFTGIDSPYEPPQAPDLRLDTSRQSVEECVTRILDYMASRELIKPRRAGRGS